jgi:hypothetical protein
MGHTKKKKKIVKEKGCRKSGKGAIICIYEMGNRTKKNINNIRNYKKQKGKKELNNPENISKYIIRLFYLFGAVRSRNLRKGYIVISFKNRKRKKQGSLKVKFNLKAPNIINITYANARKF